MKRCEFKYRHEHYARQCAEQQGRGADGAGGGGEVSSAEAISLASKDGGRRWDGGRGERDKGWKAGVRRKFSFFTDMKMWWDARRRRVALNFKHCIFCFFLYSCASTCMRTCMPHAWRSGGGLRELILFHQVDPEGWTQVIRLGVQCLYSLGHLSCPQRGSLKKSVSKVKSCKSKS